MGCDRSELATKSDWRTGVCVAERLARSQASRASSARGIGYPLISALGHTLRWRVEGLQHLDAIVASGRQPIMAFWHGRILPATFYFRRRGIVVITSENFDGEWIARIIERFGYGTARGSTSRGGAEGDAAARARHGSRASPPASRSTARADRRASRSPARSGWPRPPAIPCCRFTSRRRRHWTANSWDQTQIPKPFSTVALVIGEPIDVPADATDEQRRGRTPRARRATARRSSAGARQCSARAGLVRHATSMILTIFTSDRFADHLNSARSSRASRARRGHAGRGVRIRAQRAATCGSRVPQPRRSSPACTTRDTSRSIAETAGRAAALDADTFTSPETYEVGAARGRRGDHVRRARAGRAPARARWRWSVRPAITPSGIARWGSASSTTSRLPRPHARARGLRARRHRGLSTSTTATARSGRFYDDPSVLFISSHQYPYYPGTGAATDIGTGAGAGFTVNMPLEAGATDGDYELVFDDGRASGAAAVSAGADSDLGRLRRARRRSARRTCA